MSGKCLSVFSASSLVKRLSCAIVTLVPLTVLDMHWSAAAQIEKPLEGKERERERERDRSS